MKQALLSLLFGGILFTSAQVYFKETQPGTRTAPVNGDSSGMSLIGLTSLHPRFVCPNDGLIVADAGSALCLYQSPADKKWSRCAQDQSMAAVSQTAGLPTALGTEYQVTNPFGRILWATSGMACIPDGGTWDGGISVQIEAAQN